MKKQELIKLIEGINTEDTNGEIEGIFYDRFGSKYITDSIRLDMDGGRLIMVQRGSANYDTNKSNWKKELEFINNGSKKHRISK